MRGVTTTTEEVVESFASIGVITPADTRRALQLVGFYEYGNALNHFHQLLVSSTSEELEAMDNIVRRHPEFTVYTNLSEKVQTGPSSLSTVKQYRNEAEKLEGFRGVIALARVEFGSILAGFTDAAQPYLSMPAHEFDAEAYQELLLDGARTHYWSLLNDPRLEKVIDTTPENPIVLAYTRRLVIARSMLAAATRFGRLKYNNIQMRELSSWRDSLDEVQDALVSNIQVFLTDIEQTTRSRSKTTTKYTDACYRMLQAERRLNAGGR